MTRSALTLFLMLLAAGLRAQGPSVQYRFRHLSVADGLPQGSVYFMHQDRRGFMWLGTTDGLARFDGRNWRTFYSSSTGGSVTVWGIVEAPNGDLWVGSNRGLKHYVAERGIFENVPNLPGDVLTFPFRLDGSRLWLLSEEEGLMTFDLKTRRKQRHGPPGEGKFLRQFHRFYNNFLSVDSRGRLYVVEEESGLLRYDPASRRVEHWFSARTNNQFGSPQTITALRLAADGTLWLGTRRGLLRCDPERRTLKEFAGGNSFQNAGITDIAEGPGGLLWLATEGQGIRLFDPRTEQFVGQLRREEGEPNSLQFDEVATLFVDRQGFVWVNTDPLGVDVLFPYPPGHRFYSRTSMPDLRLSDFSVRGLAEDRAGRVWIGTELGGLNVLDPRQGRIVARYRHQPGNPRSLPANTIRHLLADPDGSLWVLNPHHLSRADPARGVFRAVALPPELTGHELTGLCHLPDHSLLLSSSNGLWLLDKARGRMRRFPAKITVGGGVPHFDSLRNLLLVQERWQGFDLYPYRAGQIELRYLGDSLRLPRWQPVPGDVVSFYQTPGSPLVYAASSQGLFRYDLDRLRVERTWGVAQGLVPEYVYGLLPDGRGNFYLSTNRGLLFFDPRREVFAPVGEIPLREYNSRAALRSRDGTLYFGSTTGLDRLRPERMYTPVAPLLVELTGLTINGIADTLNVGRLRERTLPVGSTSVVFTFTALDFLGEGRNQYRYQLRGFDPEPVQAGTVPEARYTNLEPGTYTFWVQASDARGLAYTPARTLQIEILTPFWQKTGFKLLLGLGLVGLVALGIRAWMQSRLRRQRGAYEQALRLEQERNRIARDVHDDLGSSLFALKLSIENALTQRNFSDTRHELRVVLDQAKQATQQVREIIWAVTAQNDRLDKFIAYVSQYAHETGGRAGLTVWVEVPDPVPNQALSGELRRQVFLMVKEMLNNVVKYAEAHQVTVRIGLEPFSLLVQDDGRGFDPTATTQGYGLRSLRHRAETLGGSLHVTSQPGQGSSVEFRSKGPLNEVVLPQAT